MSDKVVVFQAPFQNVDRPYRISGVSEHAPTFSKGLSMELFTLPSGYEVVPHDHGDVETAIFVLEGTGLVKYGDDLENEVVYTKGCFVFIPPFVRHQPMSIGDNSIRAIICRNVPYMIEEKTLKISEE